MKVVLCKFVFTVKLPGPQAEPPRRARPFASTRLVWLLVASMHQEQAPRCTESLRCFVVLSSKRCWCLGSLDVTSALLLTPIPQGKGFPVSALTPPRLLVRLGLAKEGELWVLTQAVYGLRESPKLWSDFRDCQLLALKLVVGGEELQLQRGRLDPNWWKVVRTSDEAVVGGLLTYVNDFLPAEAGRKEVCAALAKAIQAIWKTTPLRRHAASQRSKAHGTR